MLTRQVTDRAKLSNLGTHSTWSPYGGTTLFVMLCIQVGPTCTEGRFNSWFLAATKQLYEWFSPSVSPSVCPYVRLSRLFRNVPLIVSSWNFQECLLVIWVLSMHQVMVRGQRSRSPRSKQILPQFRHFRAVTPVWMSDGYEMMHMAWSGIEKVLYCFPKSSVKFQSHTGQKIANFDPN